MAMAAVWRQFAVRSPWPGRRCLARAEEHPCRGAILAFPPLVRHAGVGNAAKCLVAASLQRAQHPVEQLEVQGRPPDGLRSAR